MNTDTRCGGTLTARCTTVPVGAFRLDFGSHGRPVLRLCHECRRVAENMGYDPQPVPEWQARGTYRDTTSLAA